MKVPFSGKECAFKFSFVPFYGKECAFGFVPFSGKECAFKFSYVPFSGKECAFSFVPFSGKECAFEVYIYIINSEIVFVVCVFCPFVNSFLSGHNLSCDWNFLIGQIGNFSV